MCLMSAHTGNPKGVMLTHGNVVADFAGFLKVTDVSDLSVPYSGNLTFILVPACSYGNSWNDLRNRSNFN